MSRKKTRIIVASIAGLLMSVVFGIPVLVGAAVVFPQGVEGDHGLMYLALATAINFSLFATATYYLLGLFPKFKGSN